MLLLLISIFIKLCLFIYRDLGWSDWIHYPYKYRANFCKGDCGLGILIPESNYETWMQKSIQEVYKPCCTPRRMSDLNIMYRDSDGTIQQRVFRDMTVEECGCGWRSGKDPN